MSETDQAQNDFEQRLARIETTRRIGGATIGFTQEQDSGEERLPEVVVAPEGFFIKAVAIKAGGQFYAECASPRSGDKKAIDWTRIPVGGLIYDSYTRVVAGRRDFRGKYIEYDETTQAWWVYEPDRRFRILAGEDISITAGHWGYHSD